MWKREFGQAKVLVTLLAGAAIGVALFEGAARLLVGPPATHMLTPPGRDRQTDFDLVYAVDQDGRRSGCPSPESPRRTVAVIGDSFAFGAGVGDREHFAARLGCRMPAAEVLNLGSIGQDFLYYDAALRALVPRDADDIVILLYENDLPPAEWDGLSWRLRRALYRSSHAVLVLRKARQAAARQWHRGEIESVVVEGRPNNVKVVALTNRAHFESIAEPPRPRLEMLDRVLRRFIGDAREVAPGARVFVAMAPDASTLSIRHREFFRSLADVPLPPVGEASRIYRRVQATCAAVAGCAFIDLYSALSRDGESLYFPHDFHWNARGHAVVADAVVAALAGAERVHAAPRD